MSLIIPQIVTQNRIVPQIMFHSRDMQRRIWRALHCASDQEILDGMTFYEGAHGLCRMIALMRRSSVEQVAGVYAALSPMNTWNTNVSNVLDIFRDPDLARVNTTHANRDKARRIIRGENPEDVLKGRKVRAFYAALSDPSNKSPVPLDRHLINLAIGQKITRNVQLRSLAASNKLYSKIEKVYSYLGEREGIGNRLASIAWFVQRRIQKHQQPIILSSELLCCGDVMLSHGKPSKAGSRRFRCNCCRKTRTVLKPQRRQEEEYLVPDSLGRWRIVLEPNRHKTFYKVTRDSRSRRRVYLGPKHPYAYKSGWQWLSRFLVAESLGRRLHKDEHVDHIDRDKQNDSLENYRVLIAESHNAYHKGRVEYVATVAEWVDGLGFVEYDDPVRSVG